MSASLHGTSVIVTGASKGIGKGIARVFAGHGAKVLIVARHGKDAEAAAQELSAGGATVSAFAADVTKLPDMDAMAQAAVDRHGGLDVLCANAGIFPQATIEEMTPDNWDEVLNTNLKGTLPGDQGVRPAPQARLGSVEDIGHAAAFLASREAGYTTGQTILVDGGQVLPESLEALASA